MVSCETTVNVSPLYLWYLVRQLLMSVPYFCQSFVCLGKGVGGGWDDCHWQSFISGVAFIWGGGGGLRGDGVRWLSVSALYFIDSFVSGGGGGGGGDKRVVSVIPLFLWYQLFRKTIFLRGCGEVGVGGAVKSFALLAVFLFCWVLNDECGMHVIAYLYAC